MNPVLFALSAALIVIGAIIALVFLAVVSRYFWLWIQAVMTGAKVGIYDLIGPKNSPLVQLAQEHVQVGFLAQQSQKIHLYTCTPYGGTCKCASHHVGRHTKAPQPQHATLST